MKNRFKLNSIQLSDYSNHAILDMEQNKVVCHMVNDNGNDYNTEIGVKITNLLNSPKLYTEAELLKAIEYACGYQKASDYQAAGHHLIVDGEPDTVALLDELSDTENNKHKEITIQEINEYINE